MKNKQSPDSTPAALETRESSEDGRRFAPSVARNKEPIRDALAQIIVKPARLLEIASGTGEHGAFLVSELAGLEWTYSDIDPEGLASQYAWRQIDRTDRLKGPLSLDASAAYWGDAERLAPWDAIFSANMVHISPRQAAVGLIAGAKRLLGPGGVLILYGPFARAGVIAPSNAAFDQSLRSRNPDWGVRDLDDEILPLAIAAGLRVQSAEPMPSNNLIVTFTQT